MRNNNHQNNNFKKIGSFPMRLIQNETKMKIGTLNETIQHDKCQIAKEPNSKIFKMIERKNNKTENKYTGTQTTDIASKYFIMRFNSESKQFDLIPSDDWYTFKREINYSTIQLEDAEEKMKAKNPLIDYIRNKGQTTVDKKGKKTAKNKDAKEKEKDDKEGGTIKIKRGKMQEEDDDDEDKQAFAKLNKSKRNDSDEDEKEPIDLDLKEIPSDIEEGLNEGKKQKSLFNNTNFDIDQEEDDASDDDIFGKDNENEESDVQDEDLSEIMADDQSLLNQKRKGANNIDNTGKKKQKTNYDIDALSEALDNLFAKNKLMNQEKIVKDLQKLDFTVSDINSFLPTYLRLSCEKMNQDKEILYFRKHEY